MTVKQENMRELRQSLGMSMGFMAGLMNCSAPLICEVEKGRKRFSKTLYDRYTEITGLEIIWTTKPKTKGYDRKVGKLCLQSNVK